jgi:ATP-binding cassette, subfamily B, bacterial
VSEGTSRATPEDADLRADIRDGGYGSLPMNRRARLALLARYARPQRRHLFALVLLALLPAAMVALEPLSLKLVVDNALGGEPLTGWPAQVFDALGIPDDPRAIVIVAALFAVATTLANYLLTDGVALYSEWVGVRMIRQAACDVFDRLQRRSLRYHVHTPTGDALSRVTTDVSAVYTAVNGLIVAPALHLMTIAFVGWSAWRLSPSLTAVILVLAPVTAAMARWLGNHLKRHAAQARRRQVAVVSLVSQIVRSLPLVQAYTAEEQNLRTFRSFADRSVDASKRVALLESGSEVAGAVVGAVGLALVTVAGGYGVSQGSISVGDLVVFIAYARILDSQFRSLLAIGRRLRLAEVGIEHMDEVLGGDDELADPAVPVRFLPSPGGSSLEFDHVDFGYEDDRLVLRDLTLHVAAGETVAIVGPTGSGKTTLVGLVSRLFDPTSGRVLLDGVDLRDATLADVRSRVSTLRQEPLLLPISVADNIAIGRPGAMRHEVEEAARLARAHDFITALPEGFDTVLGASASLSGGERQRLAIARAFLKDAPVLVLDEPTSALDAESESGLVDSLHRVAQGRTVLVIAHRLATVRSATRVLVLDEGRLVETGSHDDLLEVDGIYARFHRLQSMEPQPR